MATVTTAQLKTTIEAALVTASITGVSVYDYPRPENRRVFPSVEIKATQPEGVEADPRITKINQRFDITVRVKQKSSGTDDVVRIKAIEDAILPALDATALGQSQIFVLNKTWSRSGELSVKPVNHLLSTLAVLVTDLTSTTGSGQIIQDMTVDFPGLAGMKLLSKDIEREIENMEDVYNFARVRVDMAPTSDSRTWFGQVEYTDARMTQLRALKSARGKITFTVNRPSGAEVLGGKIIAVDHGGQLPDVEIITIAVGVF